MTRGVLLRGNVRVAQAVFNRDRTLQRSYRFSSILDLATSLTTVFLFSRLARLVSSDDGGKGYFTFVLSGLFVVRLAQACLVAVPQKVREEQLSGTLQETLGGPTSSAVILTALSFAELRRAIFVCITMGVWGVVLGARFTPTYASGLSGVLAVVSIVVFLTAIGVALGALQMRYKQIVSTLGVLLTGVTVLLGIYFPIAELPQGLAAVAHLLPAVHDLTWMRESLAGQRHVLSAGVDLAMHAVALVTVGCATSRMISRTRGRDGFTHY